MISTRSSVKEDQRQNEHTSPYKTRAKRKSEEPKVDLREFQDRAVILISDIPIELHSGHCYLVSLSNKLGWLRIDKMWTFDDVLKMETTCFTRPTMNRYKRWECGQDQLERHNTKLLLNEDRFKRLYVSKQNTGIQHGSATISLNDDIIKREKESSTFFQMKDPKLDIKNNVSASAVVQSLGFSRFNAGAKKKGPKDTSSSEENRNERWNNVGVIMSYKDYCSHRKLKKLLESGGVVTSGEAERYNVVTEHSTRVFYSNNQIQISPKDDWIENMDTVDDGMFEKFANHSKEADAQLKKLTGKYRRQSV